MALEIWNLKTKLVSFGGEKTVWGEGEGEEKRKKRR